MDSLLERLRRDMADLSVQGDDFTRQIWRMYGTFEQMLAHHDQTSGRLTLNLFPPEMRMNYVETLPAFNAWTHNSTADPNGSVNVNTSFGLGLGSSEEYLDDDLGLDLTVRPRMPSMSGNPLLETISAIEDSSESDECEYLHGGPVNHVMVVNSLGSGSGSYPSCVGVGAAHGSQSVTTRSADFLLSSHAPLNLQGDKEFSGYAGSNSIDSGYKSSCPTPELADYHPAGHDGKRGSIASVGSSAPSLHYASQPANKLRIAMGTRVMATATAAPPLPLTGVTNPPRLATTTSQSQHGLTDPNSIDHLLSLRESLMTAIQRYETAVQRRAVSAANIAIPDVDNSPGHRAQDCRRASRHRSRSPAHYRPRSLSASSTTSNATQRRSSPAMHRKRHNRPGSPLVGGESREALKDCPSRRLAKAGLALAANSPPPGLPTRTYGALHQHHNPPQQQPVLPQRAPRISDEGIAALLSVAALKLQATHANQERSSNISHPPHPAGQPASFEEPLEKQAIRAEERGPVGTGNNKMKMEPGGEDATTSAFMLEGEIDTLLYGHTRQRGAHEKPNKMSSVSQLREQVQRMAQQACTLTDQPEDVRSRFSRVARCMLDIIEDLHKQSLSERAADGHQRNGLHGNDNASNKSAPAPLSSNGSGQRSTLSRPQPKRTSGGGGCSGSKLNAQASQQQQVQLRLDAACPANPNKRLTEEPLLPDYVGSTNNSSSHSHGGSHSETLLAGADYHVYEEILYDWTTNPPSASSQPSLPSSQHVHSSHHEDISQQPPPLPSRPATLAKPKFDFDKFLIRPYPNSRDRPERPKDESHHPTSIKKASTLASQLSSITTQNSSRSLWDQLMGTKLMHGCGTGTKISNLSRPPSSKPKGNVYTMFHDRERKQANSHIEHEPDKELPKEVIEDEYGFRIVTHLV